MSELLKDFIKETKNEFASVASEGILAADVAGHIDTGSYLFNALLSGSLYGGLTTNKITGLAGESATGKTFFALGVCRHFLDANPTGIVLYFDSESSISKKDIEERGLDSSRVGMFPVSTVEEFRIQAMKILNSYAEAPKSKRVPMMLVLDSLGMLSTEKEIGDISEGKNTQDMTRARVIKGSFRTLTLKLGQLGIPLIVTNHTYQVIGSMYPTQEQGGGSGLKYAASTIVFLSKRKIKDGTKVTGNIIHCKLQKSRMTKENSVIDVVLDYDKGLDRYYGLVEIAVEAGIFKKVSTRIEVADGSKMYEKQIYSNPERYFTPEVMEQLEHAVYKKFSYGSSLLSEDIDPDTGIEEPEDYSTEPD